MTRERLFLQITVVLGCAVGVRRGGGEESPSTGRIQEVTLYQQRAVVTRQVSVKGGAGPVEIVVGGLPVRMIPASLVADGRGNVEVRSVQYRTKAVGESPREDIRVLDEQIGAIEKKVRHSSRLQQFANERLNYISNLAGFSTDRAKMALAGGTLDAEALGQVTNLIFEKGRDLVDESLRLLDEAKVLEGELNLLRKRRDELAQERSPTCREAILFLNKRDGEDGQLMLSYLVDGAGWSPSYNLRGSMHGEALTVEFSAVVEQSTGEDWTNVTLTFSTASPAVRAKGPQLAPFPVTLVSGVPDEGRPSRRSLSSGSLQRQVRRMGTRRADAASLPRVAGEDYEREVNAGADNFQYLELEIDQKAVPQIQSARPAGDSLPTITYPVQNPTTLASRTSVQIVPVASMKLPCVSRFVATPLLTSQVYREAEVENTSGKLLLGGVAEVYLEERFVGREDMGTVASGERFCVGFGPDENLHSRRELVEKSEQSQGGNRETQVRYRLLLENSAEIPVHVRLLDRVPVAVDSASDILFTLDTSGRPLSEDVEYVRRDRVRGILRWDVEVPARALGKDALAVEYGYRMQFDRNLHLASLSESLSERAWRHESWSNGGHVRRVEDSATGTMLEVVCMPGGNGKAAFANEVRRDLSKKRAIALDVCSLEGTDARVAVGIVTGPGYTWYESKPVSVLPEEWVGVRFDLTQKDWKSMECNWEYSTLPAGLADVRKLVLLVYSEGTQCRLHVDAIRFESLD